MTKCPKICKGCPSCSPYYGNKNSRGDRVISGYFCSKKNGKITTNPKQCPFKKNEEKR